MTTAKIPDDVADRVQDGLPRDRRARRPRSRRSNFEIRKNVLKYDDVLNRQREVIYAERRRVLEGEDLHEQVRHFINDVDRRPTSTPPRPRASPRTGTSTSCGRR